MSKHSPSALVIFLASASMSAPQLFAQQGQQLVVRQSTGEAPAIAYFGNLDFIELRQPDFDVRDLPTFKEKLVLSEDQLASVERTIATYLEAFHALVDTHLPKEMMPPGMRIGRGLMRGGVGVEGKRIGDAQNPNAGELPDELDLVELENELPEGVHVGVSVRVGGPAGVEDADNPVDADAPAVAIQLENPDGTEISEETRKKVEAAAAKMAEEIKQQMAERQANGDERGAMRLPSPENFEEIKAHHEEMKVKADAFREAKQHLRTTFVNEVQASTLTEEQIERWPVLERTLLRVKTLPKGRLDGERTDLVKVVKNLELKEQEQSALAEHLEAYEASMDAALRQRNEYLEDAQKKINDAMQSKEADKALTIIDRATDLRVAVRTLNSQFTDTIASLLPPAKAAEFRTEMLRVSYPRVYGRTFGQKYFAAARKLEDLDQQVLQDIASLEEAYVLQLDGLNAQIRQAIDRHQPLEPRRPIEHLKQVMSDQADVQGIMMVGDQSENPVREAFQRRRELDERTAKQVAALLTPAQAELLPKPPTRRSTEPMVIEIPAVKAE